MKLKGFNQNDYLNGLLAYIKQQLQQWQDKTVADILSIAQELGIDPEEHYQTEGWGLGLSPNSYFKPDEYRLAWQKKHPSDTKSLEQTDPYLHYLNVGAAEDINPSNLFDESDYINNVLQYYKDKYPAEWADVTYSSLKIRMASDGITALTFHIDNNIDQSNTPFPVFAVSPEEAVVVVPEPESQRLSIDSGTLAEAQTFDASGGSFTFIEDPAVASNVVITGFGADDTIEVSGVRDSGNPAADYMFTNDGADAIATINIGGTVSVIRLAGVFEGKGDLVLAGGYEEFNQMVGFEAF